MASSSALSRPLEGDRPIESLTDDRLGYRAFAQALATSLDHASNAGGLVIALHGEWGSGKTSAVNMAIDALCERQSQLAPNKQTIVVRFNPWWFSEQENLTRAFFGELSIALGREMSEKVRTGLAGLTRRLGTATDLVALALKFTPAAAFAEAGAAGLKALIGDEKSAEKTLQEARAELEEALKEEARSVIVIMDDIDRLPPDETRQLFRLVKSLADLPFVTHLLVFDRLIANQAMVAHSAPDGPEWIEKIVQASFDLPRVSATDLYQMLFDGLNEIPRLSDAVNSDRWPLVFHFAVAPWLRTPRNVTRLLNSVGVAWAAVADDVDAVDLIAIETIRLFEPTLYHAIRDLSEEISGQPSSMTRDNVGIQEKLSERLPSAKKEKCFDALRQLFPKFGSHDDHQSVERRRQIASKRHIDSYFRLGVGSNALSSRELTNFEDAFGDYVRAGEIVDNLMNIHRSTGGTKALVLLDDWQAIASSKIGEERALKAARTFLRIGDRFLSEANADASAFSMPMMWRFLWVLEPLLGELSQGIRKQELLAAIASSSSVYTVGALIVRERAYHGRVEGEKAESEDRWLFTDEELDELETHFADRLRAEADAGRLSDPASGKYMTHWWRALVGNDAAREWASQKMESNEGALLVMNAILHIGRTSSERGTSKYFSISEAVDEWIDMDQLDAIADRIIDDPKLIDNPSARNYKEARARKGKGLWD
jgi:KAP family P-loop domain.